MDVGSHLQSFEQSLNNYSGDDPLDPWDRFIECLEKRLPAEDSKGMSLVLDRLFEQQGLLQQADTAYQRAMENQAKPADTVHRLFQTRTSGSGTGASAVQNLLQNSNLVNQLQSHREPSPQCKDHKRLSQLPTDRTVRIISRSENVVVNKPNQGPVVCLQTVSMYRTEDLVCDGSEQCFEEVRARRYFETQARGETESLRNVRGWLESRRRR
ncbi:hypothetical protein J4Q44_G00343030 [Coregonus suidteri]|uniref:BUB1 N-terminal domain-containing protein n=1 Tax=Coregonus suidteri TaxID=861788 RepID=A0AAN8KPJ4_9TELE